MSGVGAPHRLGHGDRAHNAEATQDWQRQQGAGAPLQPVLGLQPQVQHDMDGQAEQRQSDQHQGGDHRLGNVAKEGKAGQQDGGALPGVRPAPAHRLVRSKYHFMPSTPQASSSVTPLAITTGHECSARP